MDDDKTPTIRGLGKQFGQSGTVIMSGMISAEEYNRTLVGKQGVRIYDKMRRSDATVHAILQMCKLPILGLKWDIEPASDSTEDVFIADFVRREYMDRNVNWHRLLYGALGCMDFGYAVAEKTYELTVFDGKTMIGINNIGFRKQTSIDKWETIDHKDGVTQQLTAVKNGSSLISIPRVKLFVFTHDREGDNYEGISLLRYAYKDWYMKDSLIKVNAVALEKMAVGVPIISFPSGTSEPEKARAREVLRQMRANEEGYLEKPENATLEMLDLKANSTKDVLPSIKYHDMQIALSVLGQFLMLGQTETGARATSQDHQKLFLQSEEAAATNIASTLTEDGIKQLVDLNFSNLPNGYPKLTHSRLQDDDVSSLATAAQNLSNAGLLTADADLEQHFRETMHLPSLPDELRQGYEERRKAEAEQRELMKKEQKQLASGKKETIKASAITELKASRQKAIDILVGS